MSIQGYEWFNLGMNKSVPGVKPTAVGMKWKNLKNEHGGKWAIRTWVHGSRNAGVAG
jgi:hypothetical protein